MLYWLLHLVTFESNGDNTYIRKQVKRDSNVYNVATNFSRCPSEYMALTQK